jgi:hypothetical protein
MHTTHTLTRVSYGLFVALLLGLLAACGGDASGTPSENAITIENPWVRPAVVTGMSDNGMDDMEGEDEGEMDGAGEMDEMDSAGEMEGMEGMEGMHGGGGNSAAYMVLRNSSDTDRAVVSASTDVANTVELHTTEMNEAGVMSMRPVEQIDIPANGEATLAPGGIHVMLIDLTQDLEEGSTVELTLTLDDGSELSVQAPVGQPE